MTEENPLMPGRGPGESAKQRAGSVLPPMPDTAERKQAEVAQRYRMLFQEAPVMYLTARGVDGKPIIADCNEMFLKTLGYRREDVVGRPLTDFYTAESRAKLLDGGFQRALEDRFKVEERQLVARDGTIIDVATYCKPETDAQGRVIGTLATFSNITERKRMEEELQEANEKLQKSLQDLKLAQQQMVQQERMSALGQLASGITHDFNNALMPILGFSELLISEPAIMDDRKKALHMIEKIHMAGNDARQIVRRLRDVYRKDIVAEYAMIDIARIVESALSLTMPKWKEEMRAKGVIVEMATDFQPVPRINGNTSELREALTNLVFNALDAMPQGGVITFRLYRGNDASVILEVADTGVGMDQETLRRCTEPFFTTKGVHGAGLGLAMVHSIVVRHGGAMEIKSKPGAGTTIRMKFPVPVGAGSTEKSPEKEPGQLPPLRVLVIDDEARSRDLIAVMLKGGGHQVETAGGGQEGLDALRQGKFDLIITDHGMPVMGGDEVAMEANRIQPGIPTIMLTGLGDIMKDNGVRPSGVSRIVTKPISSDELNRLVASVIREAGKAQQGLP